MSNSSVNAQNFHHFVGLAIRSERLKRGISQEAFAELVDLHRTYIGSVERGERNVTVDNLNAIARALEIKLSELIEIAEQLET
jgi:transcriptional regulator with XRE-family HTH domain